MKHSIYTWTIEDGIVCIVDRSTGKSVSSVTNDAENVIEDLRGKGIDVTNVIYLDSEGENWDILDTKNDKFIGFLFGGTKSIAKQKVKQYHDTKTKT